MSREHCERLIQVCVDAVELLRHLAQLTRGPPRTRVEQLQFIGRHPGEVDVDRTANLLGERRSTRPRLGLQCLLLRGFQVHLRELPYHDSPTPRLYIGYRLTRGNEPLD